MYTSRLLIAGLVLTAATSLSFAATPLKTTRVATGLALPLYVTAPPGDTNRAFIIEQKTGLIKILNLGTGTINATPFVDVLDLATAGDEQGLLGLAFHPDYDSNGYFYVNYTSSSLGGDTIVARYQVSANPDIANAASHDVILTFDQPQTNHNGGWIGFSPLDRYLYVANGDGGSACDPGERAQNINLLLGKMLRIDVDSDGFPSATADYAIPSDNPYVGVDGRDEIWALGLRNPSRCSFDRVTGDLYIGDVGQGYREEISLIPAGTSGQNFGWDCMEGIFCSSNAFSSCNTDGCQCDPPIGLTLPIHDYDQTVQSRCAVTGGYVYRGCAIPDLRGTYFFGDYCAAQMFSFRYTGTFIPTATSRTAELAPLAGQGTINLITSFGEDGNGEIYICDRNGEVFRIIPNGAIEGPTPQDYDNDGDVDLDDLAHFEACLSGPGNAPHDCQCDAFDTETGDDAIDLRDFADFQAAYTG